MLSIIIIDKSGNLKMLSIKDFKLEEVYKKCGFKKSEDFFKQTEWNAKFDDKKYYIEVYGKTTGRANFENKYDFPPPIDNTLFFGSCAILAYHKINNEKVYTDLSIPLWSKIYEKLFGGFEDLAATAKEDEEEEDELANIPKEKKTKQGYLKDGFVVDSSDVDSESSSFLASEDDDDEDDDDEDDDQDNEDENKKTEGEKYDVIIDELGSELSEESYDSDSVTNE
jgi:hypothetical protein